MLYVAYDNSRRNRTLQFRVGQTIPVFQYPALNVLYVWADGEELDHIEKSFLGLPHAPNNRIVTYLGNDARFIVANWNTSFPKD